MNVTFMGTRFMGTSSTTLSRFLQNTLLLAMIVLLGMGAYLVYRVSMVIYRVEQTTAAVELQRVARELRVIARS